MPVENCFRKNSCLPNHYYAILLELGKLGKQRFPVWGVECNADQKYTSAHCYHRLALLHNRQE